MKIPGFYPIIDTAVSASSGVPAISVARVLATAQVGIAQFRHKGSYTREVLQLAERVGRTLQEAGVRFIVNDRADVALMLDADGVHVGQDDLPPAAVRSMVGESKIVGFSTHNEEQLRAGDREPVDYLAIGPIFATGSKENPDPVVGLTELQRLRRLTLKPLVAIGGIQRANAGEVMESGADSVAVVSDIIDADLTARIQSWLRIVG